MRGENVLRPETVPLMQTDINVITDASNYGLGGSGFKNLGYGHKGPLRAACR